MQRFKQFMTKHKLKVLASVSAITVISLIFGGKVFVSKINEENETLNTSLTAANKKIVDLTNDLGEAKLDAELARKEKDNLSKNYEENNDKAKAFAIQAAACEKIKHQLKIKN